MVLGSVTLPRWNSHLTLDQRHMVLRQGLPAACQWTYPISNLYLLLTLHSQLWAWVPDLRLGALPTTSCHSAIHIPPTSQTESSKSA